MLSVEIKKCMYLAVFEVNWSSKRERQRERERRKKRIGTEFRTFLLLNSLYNNHHPSIHTLCIGINRLAVNNSLTLTNHSFLTNSLTATPTS